MKKQNKAFTLVELLVVMVVVGILIGLAAFGLSAAQRASRDTARKATLSQLALSMESYFNTNRKYYCPSAQTTCSGTLTDSYIKTISSDMALNPAKGTVWSDYTFSVDNTNKVYFFGAVSESPPQNCSGTSSTSSPSTGLPGSGGVNSKSSSVYVYYGGGVSNSGQTSKEIFTSINSKCWIN